MKRYIAHTLILVVFTVITGFPQSAMFTKVVTAGGNGYQFCNSLVTDPDGNIYIAGGYDSTCYFGDDSVSPSGFLNIFLTKYNPSTGYLWAVAPLSSQATYVKQITCDKEGSVFIAGDFSGTVNFGNGYSFSCIYSNTFIAKYSPSGDIVWARSVGGDSNSPRCIACDDSGNIYVAGQFGGYLYFGSDTLHTTHTTSFLIKIDPEGNPEWIARSGGSGFPFPYSVTTDPSGNPIIAGTFTNPVSFDSVFLNGYGNYDIFICKYSSSGHVIWATQAGGEQADDATAVVCDKEGSVYINGYYTFTAHFGSLVLSTGHGLTSFDSYAAKLDSDGNFLWAQSIPVERPGGNQMCIDSISNIYITGQFRGLIEIGPSIIWSKGIDDIYVIKMDKDGRFLYAKSAGGATEDAGQGIGLLPSGDIAIMGTVSDGTVFDSISVLSGPFYMFIATLRQHGSVAIDEINYHSSDSLDTGDWIEIRNTGNKALFMTGWTLKDENDDHSFVLGPCKLYPLDFLILCQDSVRFRQIHPDIQNISGPFNYDLSSSGGKVRLFDTSGLLITQVAYSSEAPWPGSADGTSRTIELRNYKGELSDGTNWFTGCPGGSPGRKYSPCDSAGAIPRLKAVQNLEMFPDPATDHLVVKFYSKNGGSSELYIINATGKIGKDLYFDKLNPGYNSIGVPVRDLPPGIYLLIIITDRNLLSGKFIKEG